VAKWQRALPCNKKFVGSTLSVDVVFLEFAEGTLDFLLSKLHISRIIIFEILVQNVSVSSGSRFRNIQGPRSTGLPPDHMA